eukprot:4448918-Amphidinium_carterae.1
MSVASMLSDGATGVALAVLPAHAADPCALFTSLCAQFRIEDAVVAEHLVTTVGCVSFEDFKHLVTDAAKLDDVVNAVPALPASKRPLMAARLRQAWTSVNSTSLEAAAAQKRGLEQHDLDLLLSESIILDLHKAFWGRHKVTFSAFEEPSDYLISRVTKELDKRLLHTPCLQGSYLDSSTACAPCRSKKRTRLPSTLLASIWHCITLSCSPMQITCRPPWIIPIYS